MSDNLFYVFVSFKGLLNRPEFFVVPSAVVGNTVKKGHAAWLKSPGKSGPHKDTAMRNFSDGEGLYLEQWKLLG